MKGGEGRPWKSHADEYAALRRCLRAPALQTFYRQAAGLLVLLPAILPNPRGVLYTSRPGIMLFRAATGTVAMILAFYAYQKLPLADANALSFTRTFAAALLLALTVTGMKFLTRDHSTLTLMAWYAVLGFMLAIPPALFVWRWPTLPDLALLAGMGVLGVITQACYINGMQEGDAAAMAPIDYTRLVFAVILGYALFKDVPNTMTMLGAGIVMASTLYITLREARLGTPKPDSL